MLVFKKMDDFQEDQMVNTNVGRRTYLVTYSQADLSKYPSRKEFGEMIKRYFDAGASKVKTEYWACCLEEHNVGGYHYHVSLKLNGVKKWYAVKQNITSKENIVVNFSNKPNHYIAAYRYVTKEDMDVYLSDGHPNLDNVSSPTSNKGTQAYREKRKLVNTHSSTTATPYVKKTKHSIKPRRLSNFEVSDFITKNNIQSSTELFSVAHERKEAGQIDLANFLLSRSPKCVEDLLSSTSKLNNSTKLLLRSKLSRMDIIREKSSSTCIQDCNKIWLKSALEVLTSNKIHPIIFASAMRELLCKGRGKFRNIIITGPASSGKTFILKPLGLIFECFMNPAKDKFAWVGANEAEIILLQDFRWDADTIAWKTFLLLLEGEMTKLPAPKNYFSKDICITSDIPIFATSKEIIRFKGPNNLRDDREDTMMAHRWKNFHFFMGIHEEDQIDIKPCARCFAELILNGELV